MNTLVDWIAAHALLLWVLLPLLAVLTGDLAWQRSPHRRVADGRQPDLLQAQYFSDVVAGHACGLAWLMLCIGLAVHLRRRGILRSLARKPCR
ncbi:MAG: hypothetical protein ABI227_14790 [Rhodanobacter sp.]